MSQRRLPADSFQQLCDPLTLWHAWQAVARGKRRGPAVARYAIGVDRDLFALQRELSNRQWRPRPWRLRLLNDPKPRLIAAPAVRDRVVHRALLDTIGRHFTRSCIDTHFTCGPGGGSRAAALAFMAANRRYRWRIHLDIRRYFPSISHPILERLLAPATHHPDLAWLIRAILDSGSSVYRSALARQLLPEIFPLPARTGLPLGSYFSQWSGGWYLNGLDHYAKRELKLPGYLRYMDDFVLFDNDRQRLTDAHQAISDWLMRERALSLNPRHRQLEPSHHPAVFVGWRISRAGLSPSRRLRRRLRSRLAAAARQGPEALQRTLSAYRGLLWIR